MQRQVDQQQQLGQMQGDRWLRTAIAGEQQRHLSAERRCRGRGRGSAVAALRRVAPRRMLLDETAARCRTNIAKRAKPRCTGLPLSAATGADVSLRDNGELVGIGVIDRTQADQGAFDFEALSQGARELIGLGVTRVGRNHRR